MIEINLPHIVAEISEVFERYEDALVNNKVDILDQLFWNSSHTIRFGVSENLYGYDRIKEFRAARSSLNLQRSILHTVITTYGTDFATTSIEFVRVSNESIGRQSQTWLRTQDGWRVVAAHVSLLS